MKLSSLYPVFSYKQVPYMRTLLYIINVDVLILICRDKIVTNKSVQPFKTHVG